MDTDLIRCHLSTRLKYLEKHAQLVCEEAAHTSEGLTKLFGPKDSDDTVAYFRQVPTYEIIR